MFEDNEDTLTKYAHEIINKQCGMGLRVEDVEDLMQELLFVAYTALAKYDKKKASAYTTFAYTAMQYRMRTLKRSYSRRKKLEIKAIEIAELKYLNMEETNEY